MTEKKRIYLQPTPVRIWHWLNAFAIVTLCISGLQIRFPDYVSLLGSYKSAIYLHHAAGYIVTLSFVLWFIYYFIVSRSIVKLYWPKPEDFKNGALSQAKYYMLTYFLGWENPHKPTPDDKFNALQKGVYLAIMLVLIPLVCVTGILLLNVEALFGLIAVIGGIKLLVSVHFLLACCLLAFLPTHMYLATLGHSPTEHIKTMWFGWEEVASAKSENSGNSKPAGV